MSKAEHFIVIHDPAGEYWEGSLIDPTRAHQLGARGLISMPVVPKLFKQSGIGGFMKRAWGAGWPLDHNIPRLICPLTMFVDPNYQTIMWKARIVRDTDYQDLTKYVGMLRLTNDGGQPHAHIGGMSASTAVDLGEATLGEEMDGGGWIIEGLSSMKIAGEGFMGLALYGVGPGLRVAWAAVALSP